MLDEAIKHAKQNQKMWDAGFIAFRDKHIQVDGSSKMLDEIPGEFVVKAWVTEGYRWEVSKVYKGHTFFCLTNERPKEG